MLRDLFLRALVLIGATVVVVTEALGAFQLLRSTVLAGVWLLIAAGAAIGLLRHRSRLSVPAIRPVESLIALLICGVAALIAVTAALSPPNTYDALAYHMPRIVYWAQQRSVDFFPTSYLNQISMPPMTEYAMLQTYLLAGGDRIVNLVSTAAFIGCIVGVSSIALALGAGSRGQAMAALFCATLPGAVLQASGEKNDIMLALWLVSGAYFLLQRQPVYAGLAVGLTLATKGTAYVFAPALLIVIALIERRRLRWITLSVSLTGAVVLLNAPHYTRNIAFSGSPLGYNSPFGDGTFLYANEHLGWKSTASNALRHLSDQLGGRNPNWNQGVYNGVVRVHRLLGIDPQDPGSTWQWSRYAPPENTRHEANANNRWHLLLLCCAFSFAAWRALRHREHAWLFYGMGLAVAFLGFCFYLRWQPYSARLLVPLFILGAPTAGFLLERIRPQVLAFAVCLFLVDTARLPLLENWIRPLRGPNNLFVTPRESRYFADTGSTQTRQSYLRSVDLVTRSGCQDVGIDISAYPLEYPFQALLLARNPHVRFQHVNVRNASVRYRRHDTPQPCAVVPLHNGSA